jgi:hypothetical protein
MRSAIRSTPRWGATGARELISAFFRPWFAKHTLEQIAAKFTDRSLLWGPYRTFRQMLAEDPRVSEANPMFARVDHPVGRFLTAGTPLAFSESQRVPAGVGPVLGQDTAEVLGKILGMDDAALAALRGAGAIGGRGLNRETKENMMNAPLNPSVASQAPAGLVIDDLLAQCERAVGATNTLLAGVERALRAVLAEGAAAGGDPLQREQARAHGFAWAATYGQALHEMLGWGRRLQAGGKLAELETLMLQAAFGEYLAQLAGGLPMSHSASSA